MKIVTHMRFALAIKYAIEERTDIKLNTKGFVYGNVKPDFSSYALKAPHFPELSMDFVKQEIKKLMALKIDSSKKSIKEFSEKLGIITHYLSDFFCGAHSKNFKGNVLSHFMYELRLSKYYKRNRYEIRNNMNHYDIISHAGYKNVWTSIENVQDKYVQKDKYSFASDVIYALETCILTALSIATACIPVAI